jgi:cell division protein FtsX
LIVATFIGLNFGQWLNVLQTIAIVAATVTAVVTLKITTRDRQRATKYRQLERLLDAIDELRGVVLASASPGQDERVQRAIKRVEAANRVATVDRTRLGQTEILLNNPPTDDQAIGAQMEIARTIAKHAS